MELFEDIRPYRDDEVRDVIRRLLADNEFVDFLGRYDSPRLSQAFPRLVRHVARRRLGGLLGGVASIAEFQAIVSTYARKVIEQTMDGFRYQGIERLDPAKSYVFVSNHRDIAGDSMLVDYALFISGFKTVRIAVGDNLVQRQFATDLMRLNKSFFIRRSEAGVKKIYSALLQSSQFIWQSLEEGESIWIAQAEGRAKDGMDVTDPALIKMVTLFRRKEPFAEVIASLNIVPVSLSYEYDPCDELKAKELHVIATEGRYQKPPGEDLLSLVKGLGDYKGRVVLRFGKALGSGFETPDQVAAEVDRQILSGLELFPINFLALRDLAQSGDGDYARALRQVEQATVVPQDSHYEERLARCPVEWRREWLAMYANPVLNKIDHGIPVTPAGADQG